MKIRDLILSSGLTMKELLLMKGKWRAIKKEIRGENRKTFAHFHLQNYIESIAEWVCSGFAFIYIPVPLLMFLFYKVSHNLSHIPWVLLAGLLLFITDIWSSSSKLKVSRKLIIKLMWLNIRIKTRFVLSWVIPGLRK